MNGVIGMTDLALEMPLPDQARRYLDVARSSADLLLQVINDVLDFSKIEAPGWAWPLPRDSWR